MPYLIDGNNLIGTLPDLELRDPGSRFELINRLLAFQQIHKTRILLVFDGPPDDSIPQKIKIRPLFKVYFSEKGNNADAIIKKLIAKETDTRRFFVVSSDRELKDFARKNGASTLNSREFQRELKRALKKYKKQCELDKDVSLPSPLEVDQWKKVFKKKK
jgi:predicted RNA-binding protein with PIN domain